MTDKPQFSSKKCPLSAAFVLAMREAFGEVEVIALREGGHTFDPENRLEERDAQNLQAPADVR